MTVIGSILLLVAVLLALGAILGGSEGDVQLDLGVVEISMSVLGVFLVGAASVLLVVCGLALLRSGTRRSLRRRRELKHARSMVADHERRETTAGRAHTAEPDAGGGSTSAAGHSSATGTAAGSATPQGRTRPGDVEPATGSDPDAGPPPDAHDTNR